jgi:hypothetical protein
MKALKYPKVDKLPKDALSVKLFADKMDYSVSNVYMRDRRGIADYTIINFQGTNYVTKKLKNNGTIN